MSNKEMIISVSAHEKKVAILEDGTLTEFYVERIDESKPVVGNVYKGKVIKVLPGMQSAFVDIGLDRDAFLYVSDFFEDHNKDEFDPSLEILDSPPKSETRPTQDQSASSYRNRNNPPIYKKNIQDSVLDRSSTSESKDSKNFSQNNEIRKTVPPISNKKDINFGDKKPVSQNRFSQENSVVELDAEEVRILLEVEEEKQYERIESIVEPEEPVEKSIIAEDISYSPTSSSPFFNHQDHEFERIFDQEDFTDPQKTYEPQTVFTENKVNTHSSLKESKKIINYPYEKIESDPEVEPAVSYEEEVKISNINEAEISILNSEEPKKSTLRQRNPKKSSSKIVQTAEAEVAAILKKKPSRQRKKVNQSEEISTFERIMDDSSASKEEISLPQTVQTFADLSMTDRFEKTSKKNSLNKVFPEKEVNLDLSKSQPMEQITDLSEVEDTEATVQIRTNYSELAIRRNNRRGGGRPRPNNQERLNPNAEGVLPGPASEQVSASPESDLSAPPPEIAPSISSQSTDTTSSAPIRSSSSSSGNSSSRGRDFQNNRRNVRDIRSNREEPDSRANVRMPGISELLREGQEILVQIAKEPIGMKGARITSYIALPGRYLVYMPTVNNIGVSRKIPSEQERIRLKRTMLLLRDKEQVPGGFIVRTACEGHTEEELWEDMMYLFRTWQDMRKRTEHIRPGTLIYRELDIVQRLLRDHLSTDFCTIRVDNEEEYAHVLDFINRFQPKLIDRVKLHTRNQDILEEYNVQSDIDAAIKPRVWLKSGGFIVINQTEALVAIDVNTGKFVGRSNRLEDTITKTNLEAAVEIARQIRLRDLGGIIVLDFIDMEERRNRQRVMQVLEQEIRNDRSPSKILQFNDFGLVAITRKRVKQSLERTLCEPCPYCTGGGMIKSTQTVCYEILAEAKRMAADMEHKVNPEITLRTNPAVTKALRTTERNVLTEIEDYLKCSVTLQTDGTIHQEQYDFAVI